MTKIPNGKRWGRWEYVADNLTLAFHSPKGFTYEVDLERATNSFGILDWILQISQKVWATTEDIGNLVRAFDELAGYDLQGICGQNKEVNYKELLK